ARYIWRFWRLHHFRRDQATVVHRIEPVSFSCSLWRLPESVSFSCLFPFHFPDFVLQVAFLPYLFPALFLFLHPCFVLQAAFPSLYSIFPLPLHFFLFPYSQQVLYHCFVLQAAFPRFYHPHSHCFVLQLTFRYRFHLISLL